MRWRLPRLTVLLVATLIIGAGIEAIAADSYNLTGTWIDTGATTTIAVTQNGSSISWQGGPNNRAWIQNFNGSLNGSKFTGTFWQDEPGRSPQRYHGTMQAHVVDNCHFIFDSIVQTGQATLSNIEFVKTPCEIAQSPTVSAKPTKSSSVSTTKPLQARIVSFTGDVEYRHGNAGSFTKLVPGVVLSQGDFIATGFDSTVTLDLGYGTLKIFKLTQLKMDEFVDPANLGKTQIYLQVGNIEAKVKHVAGVRSDFSVRTPIVNASIRGSDMLVSQTKNGSASVYTACDTSYVQGSADKVAIKVPQGYVTIIGADHKATKPTKIAMGLSHLPC